MPTIRRVALLMVALLATLVPIGTAQNLPWPSVQDPSVTPVSGPSWLTHLGLTLDRTTLGQGAGRYGPSPDRPPAPRTEALGVRGKIELTGADLYRLNCQSCHRETGTGGPMEVASLLGAVRGSSLEVVREKLKAEGDPTAAADSKAKASQARMQIIQRLHKGGTRMPPRDYLTPEDVQMLFGYLKTLAQTPDAPRATTRTVTWARVGELTVKGTCHICHDATGAHPTDAALLRGAIPSLQSILTTKSVADFVHKARAGEAVNVGAAGYHRGRMPVFYYLKDEEIASAYVYLATYPPQK
jgi:mono/diheme cytochrome c family protein